ncbi:hypothetical protein Tco_0321269 [Tanacetum coccineum]
MLMISSFPQERCINSYQSQRCLFGRELKISAHTPYPRLDELKDHCLTLKNTPYPHQQYDVYNTLVNEEKPTASLLQEIDDLNIIMEEYIKLMADNARGRDQTFNLETATYGEVYCDDSDLFIDFETYFLAIVYNDASTSNQNVSSEPTVSIYNAIKSDIDFHISFSDSEDEDYTFIYNKESSAYKLTPINDLKPEPVND